MEILLIAAEKKVNIYAVKGNWQLDNTIQSKIIAMAFSMATEIERDLISKRTKEALQALKASGVKLGRPKGPGKSKLDPCRPEIEALLANGSTQRFIAKRYSTTEANLHHWLNRHRIKRSGSISMAPHGNSNNVASACPTSMKCARMTSAASGIRGSASARSATKKAPSVGDTSICLVDDFISLSHESHSDRHAGNQQHRHETEGTNRLFIA